jgi:hypothetical protein
MNEARSQPWYQLYASAVVELDPKQLIERVDATEAAIHGRLRDLQYDSDHHEERQLMEDAQHTLAPVSLDEATLRRGLFPLETRPFPYRRNKSWEQ